MSTPASPAGEGRWATSKSLIDGEPFRTVPVQPLTDDTGRAGPGPEAVRHLRRLEGKGKPGDARRAYAQGAQNVVGKLKDALSSPRSTGGSATGWSIEGGGEGRHQPDQARPAGRRPDRGGGGRRELQDHRGLRDADLPAGRPAGGARRGGPDRAPCRRAARSSRARSSRTDPSGAAAASCRWAGPHCPHAVHQAAGRRRARRRRRRGRQGGQPRRAHPAGMPVPPGFVVTTAAYREFVAASGIADRVLALAALPRDAGPRRTRGRRPRSAPCSVRRRCPTAWPRRSSPRSPNSVTCRSPCGRPRRRRTSRAPASPASRTPSSTCAAPARSAPPSGTAGPRCGRRGRWPTGHARGSTGGAVALAVVVQRMVDADAAGVMFTANPTNGRRDETVVAAAWGLGESVVSGSVTTDDVGRGPDDRPRAVPDDRGQGRDDRLRRRRHRGTAGVGSAARRVCARRGEAVATLSALGARIEAHFGAPQDIEWARASGDFLDRAVPASHRVAGTEGDQPTDWSVPDPARSTRVRASSSSFPTRSRRCSPSSSTRRSPTPCRR